MTITSVTIQSQAGGPPVAITRNESGAFVMHGELCIAAVRRAEDREARYAKAVEVAKAVYGTDRRGRAAATNSMVHEVLDMVERVAGC